MAIKKCEDLEVYGLAFDLAMDIFRATKDFPKEERYALVDQIRRSSRSISANIREGFAKRKYKDVFVRHLNDALGSSAETKTWLAFSQKCGYLEKTLFDKLLDQCDKVSAMIFRLMETWTKF